MSTEAEPQPPSGGAESSGLLQRLPPPPRAANLLFANASSDSKLYWDRSHYASPEAQMQALAKSKTLYIGNLAFSTRSSHIQSLFAELGPVANIQMGLDRLRKTPCGFCFVEYENREDALLAVANLSGTKLDGRVIRVELDAGFQPGRQYGRGVRGGQVRDERRGTIDPARKGKPRAPLKWTPPPGVAAAAAQEPSSSSSSGGGRAESSQYGSGEASSSSYSGSKREREEDAEMMGKNSRFREE